MARRPPLPPGLEQRLRAHLAGTSVASATSATSGSVVPTRDAATVALLRDGPAGGGTGGEAGGIEIYLLRRAPSMAFAADMHVFPGGGVDPRDGEHETPWTGPPPAAWTGRFRADERLTRALVCAAVRETFEESGVLLAGPDGRSVVGDTRAEDWERERLALLDRSLSLSALLLRRGLTLRADLLRPWAHWITPEFEERRYDTRFLVAALPAGQRTRDVGGEAVGVAWWRPGDALGQWARGDLAMLPPTVAVLEDLAGFPTVAAVIAAADHREIRPVLPRPALVDGEVVLLLPGDDGYA